MALAQTDDPIAVPTLPVGYHLDHFREMLGFVTRLYGSILGQATRDWLKDFNALPPAAQSLFVRMANRKGTIFRTRSLSYEDVPDPGEALAALSGAGFVSPVDRDDHAALLALLTKAELAAILSASGVAIPKGQPRATLEAAARKSLDFERLFLTSVTGDLVVRRRLRPLRYLLFLYFGHIEDSLTRFTLRDLGRMRTHADQQDYAPRFSCRRGAEDSFRYAAQRADLKGLSDTETVALAHDVMRWPRPAAAAQVYRDKLLFDLGRCLERAGEPALAQAIYALGASFDCTERWVRLAWAAGAREAVRLRLQAIVDNPGDETEALFAEDFLRRKIDGNRTGVLTVMLRAAADVEVEAAISATPEAAVLSAYADRGWQGYHAENEPWRALFGLLFWDWLYGPQAPPLQNEFQRMPASLRDGLFYDAQSDALERRLAVLADPDKTMTVLRAVFAAEQGAPNAMLGWDETVLERLDPLVRLAPPGGLVDVMRAMARDYPTRKTGFPDLLLWRGDRLRLVEVKTATDSLRRNQLLQLRLLGEADFDVCIERMVPRANAATAQGRQGKRHAAVVSRG